MDSIKKNIKKLNNISRNITIELDRKEPSIDLINNEMDHRQELIDSFESFDLSDESGSRSKSENSEISGLFEEFIRLNENIQQALSKTFIEKEEKLVTATKSRKAEAGYQILEKPNLSYISTNK